MNKMVWKKLIFFSKIVSLQCSWVQKLFDKNFHEWKVIPLYLFELYLGKNFKFHSNLHIRSSLLQKFPSNYQEIFKNWCKYLSSSVSVTSTRGGSKGGALVRAHHLNSCNKGDDGDCVSSLKAVLWFRFTKFAQFHSFSRKGLKKLCVGFFLIRVF